MAPFRMKFRQLDSTRWAIGATVAIGALGLAASVQAMTSKGPQPMCSDQSGLKAKPNIYIPPGGGPIHPTPNAIANLGEFEQQAATDGNQVMLFTDTQYSSPSGSNDSTMAVEITSSGEVIQTQIFDQSTLQAMDNQPTTIVDTPYNDWYDYNSKNLTDQRPAPSGSSSGGSGGGSTDPGDGGSSGSDDGGSSGSDAGGSSGSDAGSSGSNTGSSGGSDSGSSSGGTDPSGSSGGTDPSDPGSSGGDDGGGGGGTC